MWWFTVALAASDPEMGRSIYVAKCQACHGEKGAGDGPASAALPKPPKDMTKAGFWTSISEDQLRNIIVRGKPGTAMRAFPMEPSQLNQLIEYLQTLKP